MRALHIRNVPDEAMDRPERLAPAAPLLGRAWELRDTVTAYDAMYVALAEALTAH